MSEERPELLARGEEFLQLFNRGMEFTRELLAKIRGLEGEHASLRERLLEVEAQNRENATRCLSIEEENHQLANLYVASHQLHSTLEVDEVLRIAIEIVINLIGADVFAIYLLDEEREELRAVAAEGIDLARVPPCRVGEGRLGGAVSACEIQTFDDGSGARSDPERPLVCIPLRIDGRAIGAIALLGLLRQKRGFSALDHELFELLAGHAATAIFAARLYSQSERKLHTIQEFIDLLAR